jgi:DNA-binding response OmpR family regulator
MRILVVEDEEQLATTIARGLRREGFAVDIALDGEQALEKSYVNTYDVVVLDRDLPLVHGDEVCKSIIATKPETRVIMLTAAGDIGDRVEGLSLGADDYLPKPFAFEELVARIRALSRRSSSARPPVLIAGDITLDPARRTVTRAGRPIALTRKEFGCLQTLLEAAGDVVSAEDLLERVWDEHADPFTNTVRVTVMTLRRKLGEPDIVETLVGSGYRICV